MSECKVLLLASYCDDCTDEFPCYECLKMCNVVEIPSYIIKDNNNLGGLEYLNDNKIKELK